MEDVENPPTPQIVEDARMRRWLGVEFALERYEDPNSVDDGGRTVLHYAAHRGPPHILKKLLDSQADPTRATDKGATPLYWAALGGNLSNAECLLEHQVDPNVSSGHCGWTPLRVASKHGACSIVKILLEYQANPNHAIKKDATTPIHLAAINGRSDIVEHLLKYQADATHVDKFGRTPMSQAVHHDNWDVVRCLLAHQFGSKPWIPDLATFKLLPEPFQKQACVLTRCWSAKPEDSSNLLHKLPPEMLHLLLVSVWREY